MLTTSSFCGSFARAAGFTGAVAAATLTAMPAFAQTVPNPAPLPAATATASSAFSPVFNYTGEAAGNPAGGLRQGTAYAQQLLAGVDVDMGRLAVAAGGTFHFDVTHRYGNSLASDDIGNDTSVQEIYGGQNWHLAIISYEQRLFKGRLDVEAGRIPANVSFAHSAIYCVFQTNSACANPPFVFANSNFTYYPVSGFGIHAKAFITDRVYLHAGAYANNTDPDNDGFNFNMSHTTGAIIPVELGYTTTSANDQHPRNLILGGWYDGSSYADPLRDAGGMVAALSGEPGATLRGRSAIYVRFDQMIARPSLTSMRGLTLFGVAMKNVSGDVRESNYEEAGIVQTGTFRNRDADTIGFVVNDQQYTANLLSSIRATRLSLGASPNVPAHETMMEIAYGAQLSKFILISPNAQYIVDPDQFAEPFLTHNVSNAFVIGVHATVDFAGLLMQRASVPGQSVP
jgi:porin